MEGKINLFEQYLTEAPDDTPPDMPSSDTGPPDMPAEAAMDDGPPELSPDEPSENNQDIADDGPPDLGDDFGDENQESFDDAEDQGNDDNPPIENLELDDKISAIMNMNLYQRFLTLLNTINNQLSTIKGNSDILYTLSSSSLDVVGLLKKLDENIRLYLKNSFLNENYSKNLLFFNKCLNLLKLLNDVFDKNIRKGIKALE